MIDEYNLSKIDYLKIDTEGAELLILKGATQSLIDKKINCIQVEYGGTFEDVGFTVSDLIDYLGQYQYVEIFRTSSELMFVNQENL